MQTQGKNHVLHSRLRCFSVESVAPQCLLYMSLYTQFIYQVSVNMLPL